MKFVVLLATFVVCCSTVISESVTSSPHRSASLIMNNRGSYQRIPQEKIVGGTIVVPNSLPFQVSIQRRSDAGSRWAHYCGGVILDANVVITAAHCVSGIDDTSLRVVAGEHSLSINSGHEQDAFPVSFIVHEEYDTDHFKNDIALIFMNQAPLDLSVPSAKPINLPEPTSQYDPPAGTHVNVSGWGFTNSASWSNDRLSDLLRSVNITVVSDQVCDKAYGGDSENRIVLPSMMCAGDMKKGGLDSCQGDSGGPLFTGSGETAVLYGIVSWGEGCALASYPGIYTQVSYFLDWIAANQRVYSNYFNWPHLRHLSTRSMPTPDFKHVRTVSTS
ncbi:trypsin-1-like [Daphnia pulicaria]|uniref:trypsin-1-like n=1 Tax=Daphnia pulicaria TaxID=35523 RepID=UPI001EECA0A7|nr:trypsin-1-like [Daphnia pulicaria]XP_046632119.1 trypsin-1-like [Daphnia pulicaria]